jgi:hypothetical protein
MSELAPTTLPEAQPEAAGRSSRWTGGRIAAVVIGTLLVLFSLVLLSAGATGVWADSTQRDAGYGTTGVHTFSTSGSALATEPIHLGSAGVGWLYAPGLLGKVRIRVTPAHRGRPLFVGIGATSAVDRYLGGTRRAVISDFFGNKVGAAGGGTVRSRPGTRHFWVASATGRGAQTLEWKPSDGSWTVVVMNADGRPGIDVGADLGAEFPSVLWISIGLFVAGLVFLAGGALVIASAVRRRSKPAGA